MTKKQVGALLKVMAKDDLRPQLATAKVDKWGERTVLVATNGYVMAVLKLDTEDAKELVGRIIRREAIEIWYKLANGKSRLTTIELEAVSNQDFATHDGYLDIEYPNWVNVIPEGIPAGTKRICFNAEYAKILQDLEGNDGLDWTLYGEIKQMMAKVNENTYIMMPKKV